MVAVLKAAVARRIQVWKSRVQQNEREERGILKERFGELQKHGKLLDCTEERGVILKIEREFELIVSSDLSDLYRC